MYSSGRCLLSRWMRPSVSRKVGASTGCVIAAHCVCFLVALLLLLLFGLLVLNAFSLVSFIGTHDMQAKPSDYILAEVDSDNGKVLP